MPSLILSPQKIFTYLEMAQSISKLSVAERLKVGCVIVSATGEVISGGYNHMPEFMDACCELPDGTSSKFVVHAEHDAIRKCGDRMRLMGAVAIVTHQPCDMCAEKLISAGITNIFYKEPYRLQDGLDLLLDSGLTYVYRVYPDRIMQVEKVGGVIEEFSCMDPIEAQPVIPHTEESLNAVWGKDEPQPSYTRSVKVDVEGNWCHYHINAGAPHAIVINVDIFDPTECNNSEDAQIDNHVSGMLHNGELDRLFS
ncbi:putative dCMP deaminase [Vibrio phage 207E48.1]|nr:putative dCMP deaminase [Vibrio phage 207E48.1]